MTATPQACDDLIRSAARRLKGHQRRLFQAEVADALCGGSPRAAERRFGWGRDCVETGLHEARSGIRCVENFAAKGAAPGEVKDPQLAADIRAVVEPHTQADPELKSARRYTNLSAREVLRGAEEAEGLRRRPPAQASAPCATSSTAWATGSSGSRRPSR